jgi:ubiquinone biosynthesis protein UbiJ
MATQDSTNIEALRLQCAKIRQLAAEALSGAIKRRDAVLTEVRHEEQRLAALTAERRTVEESLSVIHDEVARLTSELQLLSTEFALPSSPPPVFVPTPQPAYAPESLDAVEDEMERLTRELESLGAEMPGQPAWAASTAPVHVAPDWSRPPVQMPVRHEAGASFRA